MSAHEKFFGNNMDHKRSPREGFKAVCPKTTKSNRHITDSSHSAPAGGILDYTDAVSLPSYVPTSSSGLPGKMSFVQRVSNFVQKGVWAILARYLNLEKLSKQCPFPTVALLTWF